MNVVRGFLLIIWIPYVISSDKLYNISIIDKGGIYFEHLGKVNHFDSEWNLITYVDLIDIHRKINLIHDTYSSTKQLCEHETFQRFSLCQTSMIILEQIIPQLSLQEKVLKELTSFNNKRVKRSYFDGIGNIFKVLFGTLSAEDAKLYNDAIENLDKNEHEVLNLLKAQSNIIKSTISNFNSTITDLNINEKIFNENLRSLSNYTKDIGNKIFSINMKQDIDEHMSLLILITTEVNNEISTIINAILFAKNNAIHPVIITPQQYGVELIKTLTYLPSQTKYPLDLNDKDIPELMSLTNLITYVTKEKLVFVIKTPLITQVSYDLYNVLPVPIKSKENTFLFVLPNFKYFLISNNKMHYTSLEDLNQCKILQNNKRYICKLESALYSVHTSKTCETELMYGNTKLPNECDTRVGFIKTEQWYKLHRSNHWLYVTPGKIIGTLNCKNNEPIDIELINSGIIKISDNCKLYTTNIMLQTQTSAFESNFNSILPPIDIVSDDCCKKLKITNITNIDFVPLKLHEKLDLESLNLASHKITKINEIIDQMEKETILNKVVNNAYFAYTLFSVIKIIVVYVLYRIAKYLWKRNFFCNKNSRILALEDTRSCCARITNCINVRINDDSKDIEMEEIPSSSSITPETPLRRSARIAQLKIN